jgi:hypothetical protein
MIKKQLTYWPILVVFAALLLFAANCGEDNPQGPDDDGGNDVSDTTPPDAVELDAKSPTRNSIALQWVSPGDDGDEGQADHYDIRYSDSLITEDNWDSATPVADPPTPRPGGQIELFAVKGLISSREYFFALKTYDEVPNASELSNCASEATLAENAEPSRITDLSAVAISDTEYLLTFTAPGDDGTFGTASVYDVRYATTQNGAQDFESATQASGEPTPRPSGEQDSIVVTGLTPGIDYYFVMKAGDEIPNWSSPSNVTFGLSMGTRLRAHPTALYVGQTPSTQIMFRVEQAGRVGITLATFKWWTWPNEWFIVKRLGFDDYEPGAYSVSWDVTDKDGQPYTTESQIQVRLHYAGVAVDSVQIRVFE